jgi:hypothetical protein
LEIKSLRSNKKYSGRPFQQIRRSKDRISELEDKIDTKEKTEDLTKTEPLCSILSLKQQAQITEK